jgi:outer membrane lipoprotein SlyB
MKTVKECVISAIAIFIIGALAGYGLFLGHDGTLLLTAIGAVAGLAGYQVGKGQRSTKTKDDGVKPPTSSP